MPENYEATICPDCGRTNPVSQKQCTCGAILGVKTCVKCGKTMISAAGNRQNVYTGEVQFFCESCWINETPLGHIFSLTPQQRKMRIASLDSNEFEAYKVLRNRVYLLKTIKYVFVLAIILAIIIILK